LFELRFFEGDQNEGLKIILIEGDEANMTRRTFDGHKPAFLFTAKGFVE